VTLTHRVVVCLDVRDGRVVKGTRFVDLRDVGDPAELAAHYEAEGADEIVFLDISATVDGRGALLDTVRRTAGRLFIPLTVGGGVRSVSDVSQMLRAGADKVAINSAAVARPGLLSEASALFGAQCVVSSIDARLEDRSWRVYTRGARARTDLDARTWAYECERLGAGEILLTSIDRDGSRDGYDIGLTRAVADVVNVPVIASGGAGSALDVVAAIRSGCADAALVAGILHDGTVTVAAIKTEMRHSRIPVRDAA
jgi:cyclase